MNEKEIMQQLLQLKAMTIRVGVIHEAQALQIRNYPLVVFSNVNKATVNVDIEKKEVSYECKTKRNAKPMKPKEVREKCKVLEKWVRTILWDDSTIIVRVNGDLVHGH